MTDTPPAETLEARAARALFAVAARDGWTATRLDAIAAEAGIAPDELSARFATREAILDRYILDTDREVLDGTLPRAEGETIRDRLFDVVMRRADIAQRHRPGIVAVRQALRRDPLAAAGLMPLLLGSLRHMLDAAGVATGGLAGALRVNGLGALLIPVGREWETDDSPDLAKTMAALDTALSRAERAEGWLARLPFAG
jgi:AcrR family transcriptional regulator